MTATATPDVVDDIVAQLRLKDAEVLSTSIYRPNLKLRVEHMSSAQEKLGALKKLIESEPGSGRRRAGQGETGSPPNARCSTGQATKRFSSFSWPGATLRSRT